MSLKYKLKQRAVPSSPQNGYYYATTAITDTMDTDAIAALIERNCTLKKSDVKAVIEELIEVVKDGLQNSMAVKLNGLGTFKLAVRSTLAASPAEFSRRNITGFHVNFQPAYKRDKQGKHVAAMLEGITAEPYREYKPGVNDKDL